MSAVDLNWLIILMLECASFAGALVLKRYWFRWNLDYAFSLPQFVVYQQVPVEVPVNRERFVAFLKTHPEEVALIKSAIMAQDDGNARRVRTAQQQLSAAGLPGLYPSNAMLGQQAGNYANQLNNAAYQQNAAHAAMTLNWLLGTRNWPG